VPLDYESLNELGAIMGSGGLIVMDEDTCMVDVARFFLEFVQDESCGKCVPCRVGIKRFLAEQEIVVKTPEIRENAANAARTAVRLGAEKVTIVYRSTREEMPAYTEEIEVAEHEGVELPLLTAPIEVVTANKKVAGITCHTMRLGEFDGSGRRRPEDAQKPVTLKADQIIAAIGQKVDTDAVFNGLTLDLTAYKTIAVSKLTGATSVPWVFAGGDVTQGPSSVVEAIAEGERAAAGIDAPVGPREKEMFFRQIPPDAQRRNVLISA
jgi:thioredoxin reductase